MKVGPRALHQEAQQRRGGVGDALGVCFWMFGSDLFGWFGVVDECIRTGSGCVGEHDDTTQ